MKSPWKIVVGLAMLFLVVVIFVVFPAETVPQTARQRSVAAGEVSFSAIDDEPAVSGPYSATLSRPVSELPPAESDPALNREVNPRFYPFPPPEQPAANPVWRDPAIPDNDLQTGRTPTYTLSFDGLSRVDGQATPPDTIGVVGMNHYVQMVNATVFAVWDKNGNQLQGPTSLNDLWTSGGCSSSNSGDPVVAYDWLEDRWILAQFSAGFGNGICVAVSQNENPLGAYYVYEFLFPTFPDYFKIAVWPDAYYMGANQSGNNVHALERDKMINGQPAQVVSFSIPAASFHSMPMPADLDGHTPPPTGEPNIFYRHIDGQTAGGVDRLQLYEFHVDFDTPANSSLGGPTDLPVTPFVELCNFNFSCIRQPGTAQRLDSITEWPMYRFVYRNFGSHEVLVANHAVNVGSDQAGVRWYELRRSGAGAWSVHQQSTQAPDGDSRWMAGIGMDGDGNIALGYNVSSNVTYPSIRYATRLAGDPLNTLQAEAELVAGNGSQTGTNRWGDYSLLSLDPADDCTFWFTGEYYAATSSNNWRTRIGAFKIPSCGNQPVTADTSLLKTASPNPAIVGMPLTYTLTVLNGGPAGATGVSVVDTLPAGVLFASAGASQGSCMESGGIVTCNLGVLADQGTAMVTIVVTPTMTGSVVNTATISALETDPNTSNNTAMVSVMVNSPGMDEFLFLPLMLNQGP